MAVVMRPSLRYDIGRREKKVVVIGEWMVRKTELEDKPNLFLQLVAWRQLGLNESKIPPRLQRLRYTETTSN